MSDLREKISRATADLYRLEQGWAPGEEELSTAPLLDGWYYARHPHSGDLCLCGRVSGHPRLSDLITTSPLLAIDASAGWARTLSRWYRLGAPDPE